VVVLDGTGTFFYQPRLDETKTDKAACTNVTLAASSYRGRAAGLDASFSVPVHPFPHSICFFFCNFQKENVSFHKTRMQFKVFIVIFHQQLISPVIHYMMSNEYGKLTW
jgi:hypothetical protein